ncbi:MAG: hypothetical protein ABEI86_13205 [Halobacteriaceae archaeon]
MVGVLSVLGLGVSLLGVVLGYMYYRHGNKPTASEIASELRDSLFSHTNDRVLRTNRHSVNVVDVKVTDNSDWITAYENADQQLGYALMQGLFIGKAEVIAQFEIPDTPPRAEDFESHPYYGKEVHFSDSDSGTGGYDVTVSDQTLIVNVNLFADSTRRGAVAVLMTMIVVSQIINDILSGKIEDQDEIPSFEEFMSRTSREDVEHPVIPMEELAKTDFEFPD